MRVYARPASGRIVRIVTAHGAILSALLPLHMAVALLPLARRAGAPSVLPVWIKDVAHQTRAAFCVCPGLVLSPTFRATLTLPEGDLT